MSYLRRRRDVWYTTFDLPRRNADEPRKQKTVKLGEMSKVEAQRREREVLGRHLDKLPTEKIQTATTTGEFLRTWLQHIMPTEKAQLIGPMTYEAYEAIVRLHITPLLGEVELAELTPAKISDAYLKLRENGITAATLDHVHRAFHTALNYGVKTLRWLGSNPATNVPRPRVKRQPIFIEPDNVRNAIGLTKGTRLEHPITLAALTGVRRGELLALRWSTSVVLDEGRERLVISEALEHTRMFGLRFKSPKTGRVRIIPLSQLAIECLREQNKRQEEERVKHGPAYEDNDLVFCNVDGSPWKPQTFTKQFAEIMRLLGKKGFRFHDVRHTFATMTLQNGTSVKEVSEILGHSTATTTLGTYAHVVEGAGRRAVNDLATDLLRPEGLGNRSKNVNSVNKKAS